MNLEMGRLTNPAVRCVGLSINTSKLDEDMRTEYLQALADETGLPCVDPVLHGMQAIVARMRCEFPVQNT